MVHINDDVPDLARIGALPKHAVIGRLGDEVRLEDAVSALGEAGIGDDHVHVLRGSDGVAFIGSQGNVITRLLESEERARYVTELENGRTLVGIFAVRDADQQAVVDAATAAGIEVLRSFGTYTYA